ncbi:MAG: biotin/lipoyl-binding protein [Lachnospiraceae bacterium]|nr:biotin/lipoyl-binding protein [Lachnospiraceae bacterium]
MAETTGNTKKKKKKKFKWGKLIVILLIIGAVVIGLGKCAAGKAAGAFTQDTAERRDIRTYHSFTGVVEPVTEQNVLAEVTGVKVLEVLVEEGDEVKEGDVVALLDRESIENQIEDLELSMSVNQASTDLSVRQARNAYYNYKNDIDNGQNSTLVNAQNQIVTATVNVQNAEIALQNAQRDYQKEIDQSNAGLSQGIVNAKRAVDSAYQTVRDKQISLEVADHEKKVADDDVQYRYDANYENAEHALDNAWISYNNALADLEAAKRTEQDNIIAVTDKLIAAQNSYLNSIDQYNIAVHAYTMAETSTKETLQDYRAQYDKALLGEDTSVNELKLARLYAQLEDCTVKAPMSGVITTLNIKEGDMISTTNEKPAAVVTDFGEMKVAIKINEYDIMGASVGVPVEITLNAIEKDYEGEIAQISRIATSEKGVSYFDSEVNFKADEDVRSGMSVEVRLVTNDLKDVLTVETKSIQTRDDGTAYVQMYAADGKGLEERDVTCGVSDGTYTEILSGLSEGDVVLQSSFNLAELQMQMSGE